MEIIEYKNSTDEDMILILYPEQNLSESMFKWQWEERLATQEQQSGTL